MSYGAQTLARSIGRALLNQAVSVLVLAAGLAIGFGGAAGKAAALAALYGGAVAGANVLLLAWRAERAKSRPAREAHHELLRMYGSSLERLLLAAVLIALGLVGLKLAPQPLLAGFIVGQMAWVLSAPRR